MPADTVFMKWEQVAAEFNKLSRRRFFNASETKQELEDAGFVEVEERRFKLPISAWSSNQRYRDIGKVSLSFFAVAGQKLIDSGAAIWNILGDRNGRMD